MGAITTQKESERERERERGGRVGDLNEIVRFLSFTSRRTCQMRDR
jgi:hypothetical protein